jgi:hypothetical protein
MLNDHKSLTAIAHSSHQVVCAKAVVQGAKIAGWEAVLNNQFPAPTKHVACWGWRLGLAYRHREHEVLVMERGYMGDRKQWYSLAWNGLNNRGQFPAQPFDDGKRFDHFFGHLMKPWREPGSGKYVLLIGQIPADMSVRGADLQAWYESVIARSKLTYDLPVVFRNHPLMKSMPRFGVKLDVLSGTLEEAFSDAEVVVTFNSTTGVESVLAGIPTVAADQGSMVWDVAGHSVGDLLRPDRIEWARKLSWKQWLLEEIESGKPFFLEQPC